MNLSGIDCVLTVAAVKGDESESEVDFAVAETIENCEQFVPVTESPRKG